MKGKKSSCVFSVFLLDVLVVEFRMSHSIRPECVDQDTHTRCHT